MPSSPEAAPGEENNTVPPPQVPFSPPKAPPYPFGPHIMTGSEPPPNPKDFDFINKPSIKEPISNLVRTTHAFISAFVAGDPPRETLDKFFTPKANLYEHGPEWAQKRLPFLARTFHGRASDYDHVDGKSLDDYYEILSSVLKFNPLPNTIPPLDNFAVDEAKGVVTVKLSGMFESVKTGRRWEEQFVYVVQFKAKDEKGGEGDGKKERKIMYLDIWADPLSAWVAVGDEDVIADTKEA
ncbi:MAG: hypothetical protein Q9218_001447 [Villophora microphyllina]